MVAVVRLEGTGVPVRYEIRSVISDYRDLYSVSLPECERQQQGSRGRKNRAAIMRRIDETRIYGRFLDPGTKIMNRYIP